MNLIGYWMTDLRNAGLPLPQELVGPMAGEVRERVCDYLTRGQLFETYRGYSWCRFRCGVEDAVMGCREFTDGEWVWPQGLVHYVRHHGIVLPEEFVARATSGRAASPVLEEEEASPAFWIAWAQERRSPEMRRRLEEALAAACGADRETGGRFLRERTAELERTEGLGHVKCLFAGCERRALNGRVFCARHCINDQEVDQVAERVYLVDVSSVTRGLC